MMDLDFGMNNWMTPPFEYPDRPMDRGKVLWEGDLDRLQAPFARYKDVDGDGIPYRTLPGNRHPHAAYFTRGTGHDENARYTEDPVAWENLLLRLKRKFEGARPALPQPVVDRMDGARTGIIAFGSTDPAVIEARDRLRDQGLPTDYLRVRAIPFSPQVAEFIRAHDRTYVVEMNRDGQMHQLLVIDTPELGGKLVSARHTDGLPLTASWVVNAILEGEGKTS
jgi:2-oxoglutarate ferredoxin oxidoreductase subunit alpha